MNCKSKSVFSCVVIVVLICSIVSLSCYFLFCYNFNQGSEFVAHTIVDDTLNENDQKAEFMYNSKEYALLGGGYYYKIDLDSDLNFLGYISYRGLLRKDKKNAIYSIQKSDSHQFLYYDCGDRYSNYNVYYRDDFSYPEIIPENVKSVELYSSDCGLLDDGMMRAIEPEYVFSDSDFKMLIISEFVKSDKWFINFSAYSKTLLPDVKKGMYYVCFTFNGCEDRFCYLAGELFI